MAASFSHTVAGATLVTATIGGSGSYTLGYTIDGARITFIERDKDIMSDLFGGSNGTPSDVLMLGAWAIIDLELVDYTLADIKSVLGHKNAWGTPAAPGTLLIGGTKQVALTLTNTNLPLIFSHCHLLDSDDFNVGTDNTVFNMKFRAIRNVSNGALFSQS